ncbi:MAG: hypothetical protein WCK49_07915 [Myxococcaceae bacterium]
MLRLLFIINLFFFLSAFATEDLSFQKRYIAVEHAILCENKPHVLCQQEPTIENVIKMERDIGTSEYNRILALQIVPGTQFMELIEEICTPDDVSMLESLARQSTDPSALDEIRKADPFHLISRSCLETLGNARISSDRL